MSNIVAGLFGAGGAANTAGGYYQNAANQMASMYGAGSPAASTFLGEEKASMQPQWTQEDQALKAQLAAQGITGSGAAGAATGSWRHSRPGNSRAQRPRYGSKVCRSTAASLGKCLVLRSTPISRRSERLPGH